MPSLASVFLFLAVLGGVGVLLQGVGALFGLGGAHEIGGVQLPGIFGKRVQEATVAAAAEAKANASMIEVPVQASMTVQAKRATD